MNPLILPLTDDEVSKDAANLAKQLGGEAAFAEMRRFPDEESYLRVLAPVRGRDVVVFGSLDRPDQKLVRLFLLTSTLREMGARRILLAAPYLAYMRQDRAFHPGESVSARHIGRFLSSFLGGLVTVDPHLHRLHSLGEVFSCPATAVAAAPVIGKWLGANVTNPLLVGPDAESIQWVSQVAALAGCPFVVLEKNRRGDRDVEVSVPHVERWRDRTPVLVDDIVSTGRTMVAAVTHLRSAGMPPPVCVAVHALFAGDAYRELQAAGASRIVSCNTVAHPSNAIDIYPLVAEALSGQLAATVAGGENRAAT